MIPTACLFTTLRVVGFRRNASVQDMLAYACQAGGGMIPSPTFGLSAEGRIRPTLFGGKAGG